MSHAELLRRCFFGGWLLSAGECPRGSGSSGSERREAQPGRRAVRVLPLHAGAQEAVLCPLLLCTMRYALCSLLCCASRCLCSISAVLCSLLYASAVIIHRQPATTTSTSLMRYPLRYSVRLSLIQYGVVWCGAVRCGVVWCGAVRCGAVRCGAHVHVNVHGWVGNRIALTTRVGAVPTAPYRRSARTKP